MKKTRRMMAMRRNLRKEGESFLKKIFDFGCLRDGFLRLGAIRRLYNIKQLET